MLVYPLTQGEIYHVYTKSIAGYEIFSSDPEYTRMEEVIQYYKIEKPTKRFSLREEIKKEKPEIIMHNANEIVQLICYCLMPTHAHLILKQLTERGISEFMRRILDSYSRYFNIKHKRKGPLWEGKFKRVLVKDDAQLLHLTRYIHLNPVTAGLVNKPEEWKYSSYKEYVSNSEKRICRYDDILDINPYSYKVFVENRILYQKELAKIKDMLLD